MNTTKKFVLTFLGLVFLLVIGVTLLIIFQKKAIFTIPGISKPQEVKGPLSEAFGNMEQFKSDDEFKQYLLQNQLTSGYGGGLMMSGVAKMSTDTVSRNSSSELMGMPQNMAEPARVSQTNVQVIGIDEPDIVKTNGDSLFYSRPLQLYTPFMYEGRTQETLIQEPGPVSKIMPMPPISTVPPPPTGGIVSVKPFPPQSMIKQGGVLASGDMLLTQKILVVFNEDNWEKRSIDGYDISNPSNPTKKWSIPYQQNTTKLQARLYKDKLYLVTRIDTGGNFPCPIRLFNLTGTSGQIPCREIYHPSTTVSTDTLYTISKINTADGAIEKNVSYMGSTSDSILYMSRDALYITYSYSGDMAKIMSAFVAQNADLYPAYVLEKLNKLQDYDISLQAKLMEVTTLLSKVTLGMDDSKRLVFENNVQNRMNSFMIEHARDLERTGIVKVNRENFNIEAVGDVSGRALNQYSLDEYNNSLRIATTTGQSWFGAMGQVNQSFSDVYVLNNELRTTGSVKDMGKSERIYSARFIADRGYVVTFRQTDPFYVLDLSNSNNPQIKGELKIPGYSSYLHPLGEQILGIGKEGDKVKLSLFDVGNSSNPQEIDKFTMNEYWSEALNNSHAFLADEKHQVFFMPGNQGGYVFSYANNKLSLVAAVADFQVQRAIYINDYLYILGHNKIVVLDENRWEKVGELTL